MYHKHYIK